MKKTILLLVGLSMLFFNCTVKEKIVFNDDYSGTYLVNFDMSPFMKAFEESMGGNQTTDTNEEKEYEVIDTVMVFADIMEMYKDSISQLPEEKRVAMEAVKDMYMKMQMDEKEKTMSFGIGLDFSTIDELKGIREKVRKAQSLNAQNDQVSSLKEGSPLGKFMGDNNSDIVYSISNSAFSRVTVIDEETQKELEELNNELDSSSDDPTTDEFKNYFSESFYEVEITFPRKIKSSSVETSEISNDSKTISYKADWMEYLKDPRVLDVNVEFVDE